MRTHPRLSLAVGLVLLNLSAARAGEDRPALDPAQGVRARLGNPVTYDVDYRVTVTAPFGTKKLRVWLPIPPTTDGQEVTEGEITAFPAEVKPRVERETKYGNRFAYFEFDNPQGAQVIRHRFKVKVWEMHWDLDPARVENVEKWPAAFKPYLDSDQSVTVDDPLRNLLKEVVPDRRGPADLSRVMAWVNDAMTYDHVLASLKASSQHALKAKRGHCSDYHGLCAAFGRALGYPTRVCYGINTFPKNSPSHCKLEAFLPPYGWVSFDVSETQKLVAEIKKGAELTAEKKEQLIRAARERLDRGFRDNTWFAQTRGTDYDLAPPAAKRVAVVRTIHAEADGVALPDPDPANPEQKQFAWMTAIKFTPDRAVTYPFKDLKSLEK